MPVQRLSPQQLISKVNWNQVFYFSVVAASGSIRAAAETLALSPSTLSEHVSQLEKDLDVRLFHRQGPKLTLTSEGRKLHLRARSMFEEGQRLLDAVSPLHLGFYPINVGLVPGPQLPLAYQWIGDYVKTYGATDMKLRHCTPEELEADLVRGRLDFGFCDFKPEKKEIGYACVASSPIRFFVAQALSNRGGLKSILAEVPLLVCKSAASKEAVIEKALHDADVVASSVISSDFPSVLIDLCRRGLGVGAFCEGHLADVDERSIRALRHPKESPVIESKLFAVWAPDSENTLANSRFKKLLGI